MTLPWARCRRTALATALIAGVLVTGATEADAGVTAATVSFTTPAEHVYTVPSGVTRVDVVAVGGAGGDGPDRAGGRAARIVGTLDVTPGQQLYAEVGSSASGSTPGVNGGGAAGGSAAECADSPGAGGGATDVRTVPMGQSGSAGSRVLVAGGGGGAATSPSDDDELQELSGGHRGRGGGSSTFGGFGGADGVSGQGGAGGDTTGTGTSGGRGGVGVAGANSGCGGGGGGGYGGGGGGAAGPAGGNGGGGGGGGSLVPGGSPAGMAGRGDSPSVTFSAPGLPAQAGPLQITSTATLKQNDIGGGIDNFANCPSSCRWIDGDTGGTAPGRLGYDSGYSSTQAWASAALRHPDFLGAFATVKPGPTGAPADVDQPFLLTDFAHYNTPVRGGSPTVLGIQTLLTVQPPAGSSVTFDLRGPRSVPLEFIDTNNDPPCDPDVQESSTPCDDIWTIRDRTTSTATADGVTWHFELLGWRSPTGEFTQRFVTEEDKVTQRALYGQVTVDTNPTTSTLTVDETDPSSPVLTLTTTPVPQTGGTVTFTDGGDPIEGCTDVPVGTDDGVTTCTPGDLSLGAHTFGAGFGGGIGYAASEADPVEYQPTPVEPECTIGDPDAKKAQNLRGTAGDDVICGGRGNDNIHGGGGDDVIIGGRGNDNIHGDAGNDNINAGAGNDNIRGGGGDDVIIGGRGNDNIHGDAGNDNISGGAGNDNIHGDSGKDAIDGGEGTDRCDPDAGANPPTTNCLP